MIPHCMFPCWSQLVYSLLPFHFWRRWSCETVKIKCWGVGNIFSLYLFFFFLSHRHKSSSPGCRPQARTEGARWGHGSVARASCPESYNNSGHVDSKCSLSFLHAEYKYITTPSISTSFPSVQLEAFHSKTNIIVRFVCGFPCILSPHLGLWVRIVGILRSFFEA